MQAPAEVLAIAGGSGTSVTSIGSGLGVGLPVLGRVILLKGSLSARTDPAPSRAMRLHALESVMVGGISQTDIAGGGSVGVDAPSLQKPLFAALGNILMSSRTPWRSIT